MQVDRRADSGRTRLQTCLGLHDLGSGGHAPSLPTLRRCRTQCPSPEPAPRGSRRSIRSGLRLLGAGRLLPHVLVQSAAVPASPRLGWIRCQGASPRGPSLTPVLALVSPMGSERHEPAGAPTGVARSRRQGRPPPGGLRRRSMVDAARTDGREVAGRSGGCHVAVVSDHDLTVTEPFGPRARQDRADGRDRREGHPDPTGRDDCRSSPPMARAYRRGGSNIERPRRQSAFPTTASAAPRPAG